MFIKSSIAFLAFCALISATLGSRKSGEQGFGCSCLVVASTETNCTGVSGKSCSDSANLLAIAATGLNSAPICSAKSSVPVNQTISFRLPIQNCKRCSCFTAPVTETRNCTALNTDTTFVKNGCSDQTSLAALAKTGNQARVCIFDRAGSLHQTTTVDILAGLGGRS